jgi:hypothetical protein
MARDFRTLQERSMNTVLRFVAAASVAMILCASAIAAEPNTYQVTGPVLSMTATTVTVQKGDEKWEIARDQATPVKGGELKVGAKVTIKYRMTATSIEVKK